MAASVSISGGSPLNGSPHTNGQSTTNGHPTMNGRPTTNGHPATNSHPATAALELEEVAIVGMACRTAGGINTPEKLWQFLLDKKHGSGEVPAERWEPWLRRDPRNAKEIEKTLKKGYFVQGLENFDASFFGISPKEAEQMDPHQRLALELSWEALEHAGINPKDLAKSDTAVYMGIDSDDYSRLVMEDIPNIEPWMGIGTAAHGVSNRVSYHLDLMGPSAAVDAACASSLVAVHQGRQAIQLRESELALVGGVNVLLAPALTRMLDKAGALSPEGICRSFDDGANGYARGEGGAVLVLKRLSSALRDGDHIWSTLKGTAVAQDGKTNGIMAPNPDAQELVGRQALARAGIEPSTVGYVEAHATSTPLGDPAEVSAIARLYGSGAGRTLGNSCKIGSIKPNVGHLEAAAGAIGLIKATLAVDKGQLAPQTLLNALNSKIAWKASRLEVVREATTWEETRGLRRAAVCSYGYGGTVSHAIIEQYVHHSSRNGVHQQYPSLDDKMQPILITAPQEKRLAALAQSLENWLASAEGRACDLKDVANTLLQRRAWHDHRLAIVAKDHDDAIDLLRRVSEKATLKKDPIATGRALKRSTSHATSQVWVFSGHGAQWLDMGRELLKFDVFYQSLKRIEAVIHQETGFSMIEMFETGDFEASERAQVATFAVQIGLSRVLFAMGLQPSAIIGHSIGEISASVIAGCITPEEGALIITRRAKLLAEVRSHDGPGGMALVKIPFSQAKEGLGKRNDLVAAIDSSPHSCVVSGETHAVEEYVQPLGSRGIETFLVNTDIAFHSPMLNKLQNPLRDILAGAVNPQHPEIPIYSTSLEDARGLDLRDVEYWVNNMVKPVQLRSAVEAAANDGYRTFLEVSSHPIVLHSVRESLSDLGLKENQIVTACAMRRNVSAYLSIKLAMAQFLVQGVSIDPAISLGHKSQWCRKVPITQWFQKPYYRQVETGTMESSSLHDPESHTLLGQRTTVAGTDVVLLTTKLSIETKPFPGAHPLDGTEIIPAGVYVNTFHHATGGRELSNIRLRVPVSMTKDVRKVQVIVQGDNVSIASTKSEKDVRKEFWINHASCKWAQPPSRNQSSLPIDIAAIQERIGTKLPDSFAMHLLTKIGVGGIAFPWKVIEHYGNETEMIVKVDLLADQEVLTYDQHSWAPLLDAATSVGSSIFFNSPSLRIISSIGRVTLHSREPVPKIAYLHVEEASDKNSLAAHVHMMDESGQMLAQIQFMTFSEVEGGAGLSGSVDSLVHQIDWIPPKFSETPRPLGNVVIVSRSTDLFDSARSWMSPLAELVFHVSSAAQIEKTPDALRLLSHGGSSVVYLPCSISSMSEVSSAADDFVWEAASLLQTLNSHSLNDQCKMFILTNGVYQGLTFDGLAQGALVGLGRIIAAEHPDTWGGLIDNDVAGSSSIIAMMYAQGHDILRNTDGLPRRAIMRPLSRKLLHSPDAAKTLLPKPRGLYVITGGLGSLGLDTADFLVGKGARRILLISRRAFPARSTWSRLVAENDSLSSTIRRIQDMEKAGAAVNTLALDISLPNAARELCAALDDLQLPQVLGVVHCAGVLEDSLVLQTKQDSFRRVMAPKVKGAMALHEAFPVGTLDFFVLYSSIGQLVGTAGQASYGSGNAFLDALAMHRRASGDNSIAMQFTAWRDSVMGSSTEFLTAELESKGITDISSEEAFRAWEHLGRFDIASAVVTRCLAIDEGEVVAVPILEDVAVRRARVQTNGGVVEVPNGVSAAATIDARPKDSEGLKKWLEDGIRQCIAAVLMMPDITEIDGGTVMNDLGIDSVMTVALRRKFQEFFQLKVPPTLTWKYPTVDHMVPWFAAKILEA